MLLILPLSPPQSPPLLSPLVPVSVSANKRVNLVNYVDTLNADHEPAASPGRLLSKRLNAEPGPTHFSSLFIPWKSGDGLTLSV